MKAAIEDVEVRFKHPIIVDGDVCKALYDDGVVWIDLKENGSWDEVILSFLHECWHHVKGEFPEYVIDEALDRVAFTSPALRWAGSRKVGDALCKFEKWEG